MIKRNWLTVCLVLVILLVTGQTVSAQYYWLRLADQNSVTLDIFKPNFDHEGYDFLTSVIFLSGYYRASDQFALTLEYPISNADVGYGSLDFGETMLLGNPYVGMEYTLANFDATQAGVFRLGIRPPLAQDDKWYALEVGYLGVFDRFEAFVFDVTTLSGGGGYRLRSESGFGFDVDVNGNLFLPADGDNELYLDYNLTFWALLDQFKGGIGFAGRWWTTQDGLDFGEATVHQLGMLGSYDFGQFRPGLHLRVPVDDDLSDILTFTWGISLTAEFE
jgi:hypothetical protein